MNNQPTRMEKGLSPYEKKYKRIQTRRAAIKAAHEKEKKKIVDYFDQQKRLELESEKRRFNELIVELDVEENNLLEEKAQRRKTLRNQFQKSVKIVVNKHLQKVNEMKSIFQGLLDQLSETNKGKDYVRHLKLDHVLQTIEKLRNTEVVSAGKYDDNFRKQWKEVHSANEELNSTIDTMMKNVGHAASISKSEDDKSSMEGITMTDEEKQKILEVLQEFRNKKSLKLTASLTRFQKAVKKTSKIRSLAVNQ
jgi:hypothetical protein